MPRPGPPGRGAARGAARAAGRRPHARAARHPGDVPRHRGLRPAGRGGVRHGRGRRRRPPRPAAPGASGRPGADPDQPAARRCSGTLLDLAGGRAEASAVLDLRRRRPGAPPVRARRQRPRDDHRLGRAGRRPLGLRRAAPGAVRARRLRPEHLALRPRPGARRGGDVRRRQADGLAGSAPRCPLDDVGSHQHRAGRPARRAPRPAAGGHRPAERQPPGRPLARHPPRGPRRPHGGRPRRRVADRPGAARAHGARRRRGAPRRHASSCGCPTSAR